MMPLVDITTLCQRMHASPQAPRGRGDDLSIAPQIACARHSFSAPQIGGWRVLAARRYC